MEIVEVPVTDRMETLCAENGTSVDVRVSKVRKYH